MGVSNEGGTPAGPWMPGIGQLNEKPLHASLKEWYTRPGDRLEVAVDGFVIDIVRDDVLLEIQTGSFASIKSKLSRLAGAHPLRLIYPIAREKWIVKLARDGGDGESRRKSPKRGRVVDLFWEMVSFPRLLASPHFTLEVAMIREEEVRRYEGKRRWRSRGWGVVERRLLEVVERKLFREPGDWRELLPEGLPEPFTTRDLAEGLGISRPLAQKMAYCLRETGVLEVRSRRGRANSYGVAGVRPLNA